MIPTPNYDPSILTVEVDTSGTGTWVAIQDELTEITISRSVEVEGWSTSPNVSTCSVTVSARFGTADYLEYYGLPLRAKYGSTTLYRGVVREVVVVAAPEPEQPETDLVGTKVTLNARDGMSDLLKRNISVTIPAATEGISHGELVEDVCASQSIDITTSLANLVVGGPASVQWSGTLLDFLRRMAASCHARFWTTNLNVLHFECTLPSNTLELDYAASPGYGTFNDITLTETVDEFASAVWINSITGARRGARHQDRTENNEVEVDSFISGPRLTTWLQQARLKPAPEISPTEVTSTDIEHLHIGMIDPSEAATVIYGEETTPYECAVVGIEHRIVPTLWTVTYDLVPWSWAFAIWGVTEYEENITGDINEPQSNNKDASSAPGGKSGKGSPDDDTEPSEGGGGGGIGAGIVVGGSIVSILPIRYHLVGSYNLSLDADDSGTIVFTISHQYDDMQSMIKVTALNPYANLLYTGYLSVPFGGPPSDWDEFSINVSTESGPGVPLIVSFDGIVDNQEVGSGGIQITVGGTMGFTLPPDYTALVLTPLEL